MRIGRRIRQEKLAVKVKPHEMHEYEAETKRVKKVKFKGKALLIF